MLSQVKLIAEPWDLGAGGYQVGNFPRRLGGVERQVPRHDARVLEGRRRPDRRARAPAHRLERPLRAQRARRPYASINFVTAHDGFTLHDLVSYNGKHNEANGEDNRDGDDNNLSWNCGVEGRPTIRRSAALRERQKRNLLATLLLSQGVPMLLAGDEIGRTQRGNNNAYCQDNEITLGRLGPRRGAARLLVAFTPQLIALAARAPGVPPPRLLPGAAAARPPASRTSSGSSPTASR